MGEAQFEAQLQKTVIKKTRDLSEKIIEETGIASSLEERDIHDYVIMAINEAKRAEMLLQMLTLIPSSVRSVRSVSISKILRPMWSSPNVPKD